jgi:hypothetical protein
MVTIGTNRFPHFGQRVVRSMRSSRFFLPMAHWFHGGAGPNSPFSFHRNLRGEVCFGATQASVTALSITCRWTLLHSGQVNVRKSWPNVLGSIAVNLIGEPQAVHCGPWFCVSSMVAPSVRSPEFPGKPPYVSRFHRIARNDFVLYVVALRTFEPAMLKAHRTRANARKHHARRAAGTARALNWSERRAEGKISLWHDTSLHLGGSVQHSQSPINAEGGAVMQPLWNLGSIAAGQYCSLAQIKISYPKHDLPRSKHSPFSN